MRSPLLLAAGLGIALGVAPRAAAPADAVPEEKSPKPTAEEWKSAKEISVDRRGARAEGCHVWRVREWARVSCPDLVTASIAFLGGSAEGTAFWIDPPESAKSKLPAGGEAMFPMRRGDRRVLQFMTFGTGYEGPYTQLPALVVQESWAAGDPHPTLMMY